MGRGWREAPRASPFTLRCHWSLSRSLGHAPELACALSIYLSDTWKVPRVTRASRDSLGSNHRGDHNSSRDPSAAARVAIFSRGEDLQQRRPRAPVSSPSASSRRRPGCFGGRAPCSRSWRCPRHAGSAAGRAAVLGSSGRGSREGSRDTPRAPHFRTPGTCRSASACGRTPSPHVQRWKPRWTTGGRKGLK